MDAWSAPAFEQYVTAAIIAQYETQLEDSPADLPAWASVGLHQLQQARRVGVFIPSPDRLIFRDLVDGIDGVPHEGCCSLGADKLGGSYHRFNYFRRIKCPPRALALRGFGPVFEQVIFWPRETGPIQAARAYLQLVAGKVRLLKPHPGSGVTFDVDESAEEKLTFTLNASIQYVADSRHTWTITVEDESARVCVGANAEAVKSVLYLRSAPLTATGRKRPVLALIRAHRRRIERGIDVDVRSHLRGVSRVEMNGIQFLIRAPAEVTDRLAAQ